MGEELKLLVLALALAFLAESMTEYIFGQAVDHFEKLAKLRWALMYVALGAGVGLAFFYQVDLLALIGGQAESQVGYALSGLIVGRGANFVHDFISRYIRPDFRVFELPEDEQRYG